jgi:hypothetical protein
MFQNYKQHSSNMNLYPRVKNAQGKLVLETQALELPASVELFSAIRRLVPNTGIPTTSPISAGAEIDFFLTTPMGKLKDCAFEITLLNTTATATSVNLYQLWDHIDCEVNGTLYNQYYPDQLYTNNVLLFRDSDTQTRMAPFEGLSATTYQPIVNLPASSQATFLIQFPIFSNTSPDFRQINGDVRLRFYTAAQACFCLNNASANPVQFVSFNLVISQVPTPFVRHNFDMSHRYLQFQRQIQTIQMTANSQYTVLLSTLTGYSPYIFVMVRPAGSTQNATSFQTYEQMALVQLNDASNNILGIQQYGLLNNYFAKDFVSNFLAAQPNIYLFQFCLSPMLVENSGVALGGYQFSGRETLNLTTPAGLSTANYDITIWCPQYNYFNMNANGTFSYTK